MSTGEGWVLLEAGCAECDDWPLIRPRGTFPTAEAAAASIDDQHWTAHPRGGFISQQGDGAYWIAPVSSLAQDSRDDERLSRYDAPPEHDTPATPIQPQCPGEGRVRTT
jgi:hypothetical protein